MSNRKISVGLFCRVLPHYRIAIFEHLSKVDGIDLTVYYSREPKYYSLKSVDPGDLFPNRQIRMKAVRLGNQELLFQPEIKRIIASGRHDVVVLSGNPRLLSNFPALWEARRKRVGIVWWSLGIMANQSSITLAIRRWLMRIPEAILLYTQDERDYFVSKGLPKDKVFVAQNTISVKAERGAAKRWSKDELEQSAREKGLEGKKLFLFCGLLREKKRIKLLFEAFRILLSEDLNYHLIVIGGGESQGRLRQLAQQIGIGEAITWLGPVYDPNELAPWFLISRALVVPRAIGLASFHGFAYGLPCITSDDHRYQTPEATGFKDKYNCLLFRDEDVRDLAEKIKLLGEDDKLQSQLSANAKRTMEEEYTTDRMVDGFVMAIRFAKEYVKTRS